MQRGHIHSPSGAQESPRQSRWNHSTEHVELSQAIISPYSPWPHKQHTSFPTKDRYHFSHKYNTAKLIFQSFSINIPLPCLVSPSVWPLFFWRLLAAAFFAPYFVLVDTSDKCHSHISTSSSVKSVSFASASFSSPDRLQPFLSEFFSASAITTDGGFIIIPCLPWVW